MYDVVVWERTRARRATAPSVQVYDVVVWAEQTAFNVDEDGDGNAANHSDSVRIPLVASDGGIVGFGAPIIQDDTRFARDGNEECVVNVFDAEVGGGSHRRFRAGG